MMSSATVQGLHAEWESSDREVIYVNKDGEAIAGKPGTATLTVRAGRISQRVHVHGPRGWIGRLRRQEEAGLKLARETGGVGASKSNSLQAVSKSVKRLAPRTTGDRKGTNWGSVVAGLVQHQAHSPMGANRFQR